MYFCDNGWIQDEQLFRVSFSLTICSDTHFPILLIIWKNKLVNPTMQVFHKDKRNYAQTGSLSLKSIKNEDFNRQLIQ